jgi:hypothetical protein
MAEAAPVTAPTSPASLIPPTPAPGTTPPPSSNKFLEQFPEDLRGDASLAKFENVADLGKSYINLQKQVGGRIKIPGEDAKPEEWKEFHSKLGVPDSPEKYGLKAPELPEAAAKIIQTMTPVYSKVAHDLGLTPKQAQGLMDWFGADAKANIEGQAQAQAKAIETNTATLKTEWGSEYDKNLSITQRAFKRLTDDFKDPIAKLIKDNGLESDPSVLKFFHKLANELDEDKNIGGGGGNEQATGDALAEIAKVRNDKSHPFHDPNKSGHKEAVAQMNKWYEIAYPES